MNWNRHSEVEGSHAFLSPSKYHWINYSEEKLKSNYISFLAIQEGTDLHALAAHLIRKGIRLEDIPKTLNMFVNDAVGYKMQSEQPLFYSENCYGTADAISFHRNILRIHDLKTGVTPTHMEQLMVYAALFCLEYRKKPGEIRTELRIYQNNEILAHNPEADEIAPIMDKIVTFDKIIRRIKEQEG